MTHDPNPFPAELINNPFDGITKVFLTDKATAIDLLLAHLPEPIKRRCQFHTLQFHRESYVDEQFRHLYSDIVMSVDVELTAEEQRLLEEAAQTVASDATDPNTPERNTSTTEPPTADPSEEANPKQNPQTPKTTRTYFYFLIEHQSTPDRLMPARMLCYATALLRNQLKSPLLPPVIPILFYCGTVSPYPYSCQVQDCFYDPDLVSRFLKFDLLLVDISIIPDEELMTHGKVAMLELLLKHIRIRDHWQLVAKLVTDCLKITRISHDFFRQVVYCVVKCTEDKHREEVLQMLKEKTIEPYQTDFKSAADGLIEIGITRGRQEGVQQGIQQGIQQGMQQGRTEGWNQGVSDVINFIKHGASIEEVEARFGSPKEETSVE